MKKVSQATLLVEMVLDVDGVEFFHSPTDDAYVLIPCGTHRECWPLRSTIFRRWLARLYFDGAQTAPGSQALQDALGVLEGKALFTGFEHEVHLRLAEHDDAIWLDLGDEYWQAVKITRSGWTVVHDPPVRFRRPGGMLAMPTPTSGGSFEELRPFVNTTDADWTLFLAWLVGALRPRGPYAVLVVNGEQGSAKSTLMRVARALVDPNEAPVRREPKDGQDLIVAARNGLIVAYDNVSRLSPELSDDLARLATGAGFGARQLYTDLEEIVVQVARPVALNGIEEIATRGDLLDRALVLTLPKIDEYRDEDLFWRSFAEAAPRILGALLTAVSSALRLHTETSAPNLRMADSHAGRSRPSRRSASPRAASRPPTAQIVPTPSRLFSRRHRSRSRSKNLLVRGLRARRQSCSPGSSRSPERRRQRSRDGRRGRTCSAGRCAD